MKKLVIIGNTHFAEIAHLYFSEEKKYDVVGFAVDKEFKIDNNFKNLPLITLDAMEKFFSPQTHEFFVAITFIKLNRVRTRIYNDLKARGYKPASFISKHSFVASNAKIGEHVFIFEDNTIQPFTEIADNVILWSGNHIGHHTKINENVFISSHVVISGGCSIGKNSFIGVNASISNNVKIAEDNFIAIGSIITKNTEDDNFYAPEIFASKKTISAKKYCKI